MLPKNKIDELIKKHSLLEKELSSLEINKKNFAEKSIKILKKKKMIYKKLLKIQTLIKILKIWL